MTYNAPLLLIIIISSSIGHYYFHPEFHRENGYYSDSDRQIQSYKPVSAVDSDPENVETGKSSGIKSNTNTNTSQRSVEERKWMADELLERDCCEK
jgi:hypothetical protein